MASMFRRNPRAIISALFREVFAELVAADPEVNVLVAVEATAAECGMVDYDALAIAERLLTLAEKAKAKASSAAHQPAKGPRRTGSGFGAEFSSWVGELSTEKLCLWLSDYDLGKARALYCDTDIDDLSVMVDIKINATWEMMKVQFEACVLGAGGKLKGKTDATVHEVDMSNTQSVEDMIAQMRALGF